MAFWQWFSCRFLCTLQTWDLLHVKEHLATLIERGSQQSVSQHVVLLDPCAQEPLKAFSCLSLDQRMQEGMNTAVCNTRAAEAIPLTQPLTCVVDSARAVAAPEFSRLRMSFPPNLLGLNRKKYWSKQTSRSARWEAKNDKGNSSAKQKVGEVVKRFTSHVKWLKIEISEDQEFQATLHYSILMYFDVCWCILDILVLLGQQWIPHTDEFFHHRITEVNDMCSLSQGVGVPAPSRHCIVSTCFHYSHVPEQKEEANQAFSLTYKMAVTTSLITSRFASAGGHVGPPKCAEITNWGLNIVNQASGKENWNKKEDWTAPPEDSAAPRSSPKGLQNGIKWKIANTAVFLMIDSLVYKEQHGFDHFFFFNPLLLCLFQEATCWWACETCATDSQGPVPHRPSPHC